MARKLGLTTKFDCIVPLHPDQLVEIRQDKNYPKLSHVKTTMRNHKGKPIWFSFKHSAKEIIEMYYLHKSGNVGGK